MSALSRARERLARRRKNLRSARSKVTWLEKRVANTKATIARIKARKNVVWHPDATRQIEADSGPYRLPNVPAKLIWHTTEGTSFPDYAGTAPHFTLNPRTGELRQHIAINRAAMALMHPAGTAETNHAHAIQVELIGFASTTQDWTDEAYARIASLARWIEAHAGVARKCSVTFTSSAGVRRLSSKEWLAYSGHCGHQHVPANSHWDPGRLDIDRVL